MIGGCKNGNYPNLIDYCFSTNLIAYSLYSYTHNIKDKESLFSSISTYHFQYYTRTMMAVHDVYDTLHIFHTLECVIMMLILMISYISWITCTKQSIFACVCVYCTDCLNHHKMQSENSYEIIWLTIIHNLTWPQFKPYQLVLFILSLLIHHRYLSNLIKARFPMILFLKCYYTYNKNDIISTILLMVSNNWYMGI